MNDIILMFSTENGIIDFDEIDISDINDVTIKDLQHMDSQLNNARLDIRHELRRRGC